MEANLSAEPWQTGWWDISYLLELHKFENGLHMCNTQAFKTLLNDNISQYSVYVIT